MARSIGSLTSAGVSQWKHVAGSPWGRYRNHWLITLLLIFATLLLYGLLLVPVSRPIYTVTHDIRLAQTINPQNGEQLGALSNLSQFELNQVVTNARRAGVIQQAVDGLEITDRINDSRIGQIKIVTYVDAASGKSMARVKVLGESADETEKVARVVGTTLLRFIVNSGLSHDEVFVPGSEARQASEHNLGQALANEGESFESLRSSWLAFHESAEELANSTPVTTLKPDEYTTCRVGAENLANPEQRVNPAWIDAERQLRELRREREQLTRHSPADLQLGERMDSLVRDAHETLNRTPVFVVMPREMTPREMTPREMTAGVKPPIGDQVEVEESDAETADWLDLIVSARNQISPMVELHEEHREELLAKIRALVPGAAGPSIIIGWSESAPRMATWGQGISKRSFILLMCLCIVLSVVLSVWLAKVAELEKIHDLRELTATSEIPVIAAVNTGVGRSAATSMSARLVATWTRRSFRLALFVYIVAFAAASLTPNGSIQAFVHNPREMLGQAFLLFSSLS